MTRWRDNKCADAVLMAGGKLNTDEIWTIKLLEVYLVLDTSLGCRFPVYYFYEVKLSSGNTGAALVRTRRLQKAPGVGQSAICIIDMHRRGKALFTPTSIGGIDWDGEIDWDDIPYIKSLVMDIDDFDCVPYDQMAFQSVSHYGSCGYMAIGLALGIPWKKVFRRVVEETECFDHDVAIPGDDDGDALRTQYWLTSEIG